MRNSARDHLDYVKPASVLISANNPLAIPQHVYRGPQRTTAAAARVGKYQAVSDVLFKDSAIVERQRQRSGRRSRTALNARRAEKVQALANDPAGSPRLQRDYDMGEGPHQHPPHHHHHPQTQAAAVERMVQYPLSKATWMRSQEVGFSRWRWWRCGSFSGAIFVYAGYIKLRDPWQLFAASIASYELVPIWMAEDVAKALPWFDSGGGRGAGNRLAPALPPPSPPRCSGVFKSCSGGPS